MWHQITNYSKILCKDGAKEASGGSRHKKDFK